MYTPRWNKGGGGGGGKSNAIHNGAENKYDAKSTVWFATEYLLLQAV